MERMRVLPRDIQPGDKIECMTSGEHFLPGPAMLPAEDFGFFRATVKEVVKVRRQKVTAYRVYFVEYDELPDNRKPWAQYRYLRPTMYQAHRYIEVERGEQ